MINYTNKAPYIRRRIYGRTTYFYRICPYSTVDTSNRIPSGEKSTHYTTSGWMSLDVRGGHDRDGWFCSDPNCSFFTGVATSGIPISSRKTTINADTGEYTITEVMITMPVCSGTQYWEQ
jgi:hypothetical protein